LSFGVQIRSALKKKKAEKYKKKQEDKEWYKDKLTTNQIPPNALENIFK